MPGNGFGIKFKIMSLHIGAQKGEIADIVLLPGDPLRAKFIAEKYLEDVVCYSEVRAMYGYTGIYKGKRISVQGTGMGIPSISIMVHELICDYDVKKLVRVGSCGSINENIELRDVVLAMSASTDSNVNKLKFRGMDYAPTASFNLLQKAYQTAADQNIKVHVGNILSSDVFYYEENPEDPFKIWRDFGVLVVEMESSALYTIAAKYGVEALSILTVSDHIASGAHTSQEEREKSFMEMVEVALEAG